MTTKFDEFLSNYAESLLTEAPIAMDSPEETQSVLDKIVDNIMMSKNTTGHWVKVFTSKKLSKKETESKSDQEIRAMVKELVLDVIKRVLPEKDHTYNPDLTKDTLKSALKDAIKSVFEINSTYSDFLSARFANKELLGKVKDVVERGLSDDLENVIEVTDEGAEIESFDDTDETDQAETSVPKTPQPSTELSYHPEIEYYFNTLTELKSGTLSHDLRIKYDKLDPLKGEVYKGKDFVKMFQKYGLSQKDVNDFIKNGILEPTEDYKDSGDTEGFEKTADDFVKDYVSGAVKDYQSSGPGSRFGTGDISDIFG